MRRPSFHHLNWLGITHLDDRFIDTSPRAIAQSLPEGRRLRTRSQFQSLSLPPWRIAGKLLLLRPRSTILAGTLMAISYAVSAGCEYRGGRAAVRTRSFQRKADAA
jgi:hypothetical protein